MKKKPERGREKASLQEEKEPKFRQPQKDIMRGRKRKSKETKE